MASINHTFRLAGNYHTYLLEYFFFVVVVFSRLIEYVRLDMNVSVLWDTANPSKDSIGSLSNHDGNANENVSLKMTSKYFKLFRDSFNSFNLSNVTEQSGS